jgi:hypothetical protein
VAARWASLVDEDDANDGEVLALIMSPDQKIILGNSVVLRERGGCERWLARFVVLTRSTTLLGVNDVIFASSPHPNIVV